MRFHPLWATLVGMLAIGSVPTLVKNAEHGSGQRGEAEQQKKNTPPPMPAVDLPTSPRSGQRASCPGTRQSQLDCEAISAIANVRQAAAAERFNWIAIIEIFVGLVTAFVAGLAAKFASDAVKAAGKSLALERDRSVAELRPWVKIGVVVNKFEIDSSGLSIAFDVVFSNIGRTTAENFICHLEHGFSQLDAKAVEADYAKWKHPGDRTRQAALMPNEERGFGGMVSTVRIPWSGGMKRKCVAYAITATTFYWSALDERWHRTDRSFTIGRKDDSFNSGVFIYDDMVGKGADLVTVKPFWAGKTT